MATRHSAGSNQLPLSYYKVDELRLKVFGNIHFCGNHGVWGNRCVVLAGGTNSYFATFDASSN